MDFQWHFPMDVHVCARLCVCTAATWATPRPLLAVGSRGFAAGISTDFHGDPRSDLNTVHEEMFPNRSRNIQPKRSAHAFANRSRATDHEQSRDPSKLGQDVCDMFPA